MEKKVIMVPPTDFDVGYHEDHVAIAFRGLSDQLGLADEFEVALFLTIPQAREFAKRILSKADDAEAESSRH